MARVTETTVKVPAPPRTFTVEVSEAQLMALAKWSYSNESGRASVFYACPLDIKKRVTGSGDGVAGCDCTSCRSARGNT